jgi:hypothetical protein
VHVVPDGAGLAGRDLREPALFSFGPVGMRWEARALQTGEQQRPGSVKTLAPSKLVAISVSEVLTQT